MAEPVPLGPVRIQSFGEAALLVRLGDDVDAAVNDRVHRLAALLGAVVMIALHVVPYDLALRAIDMNVIFLLFGMMVMVGIMAQTGVFEWLAIHLARLARGNGLVLMVSFLLMTAILSAFLDNVTTILLIAPLTILVTEILEIPTKPLLILEAIFSNIGGTATLVGELAIPVAAIEPGGVGKAELRGTAWTARNRGAAAIPPGCRCKVVQVDGLVITIQPE
jgi:di/tricarboxylate transporter